jgi:hypothetical protein
MAAIATRSATARLHVLHYKTVLLLMADQGRLWLPLDVVAWPCIQRSTRGVLAGA